MKVYNDTNVQSKTSSGRAGDCLLSPLGPLFVSSRVCFQLVTSSIRQSGAEKGGTLSVDRIRKFHLLS